MIVRDESLGYPEQPFLTESSSVDHHTAPILAYPVKPGMRSDRSERVGCEKSGKYTQYRKVKVGDFSTGVFCYSNAQKFIKTLFATLATTQIMYRDVEL